MVNETKAKRQKGEKRGEMKVEACEGQTTFGPVLRSLALS